MLQVMPSGAPRMPSEPIEKRFDDKVGAYWADIKPQRTDFEDLIGSGSGLQYEEAEFGNDWDRAETLKRQFFSLGNESETAQRFEACLLEAVENGSWFQENVSATPGSQFDDYCRQTDLVIVFREAGDDSENKYTLFAVDATISDDADVLARKEENILRFLLRGELGEVKYLFHEDEDILKGRFFMPKVIVRILPYKVDELMRLLVRNKTDRLSASEKERLDKMKNEFIYEILTQIDHYLELIDSEIERAVGRKLLHERLQQVRARYVEIQQKIVQYQN